MPSQYSPYVLSLSSVFNEMSKYAIKITEAPELGIKHSKGGALEVGTWEHCLKLSEILLGNHFSMFRQRLTGDILLNPVVIGRKLDISYKQAPAKACYELASLCTYLTQYAVSTGACYSPTSYEGRVYKFLVGLASKVFAICMDLLDYLLGEIMGHRAHFDCIINSNDYVKGAPNDGTSQDCPNSD